MPRAFKSIDIANIPVHSDYIEQISEIRYSKISIVREFKQSTVRAIFRVELSLCSEE